MAGFRQLRPVEELILPAVIEAVRNLDVTPEDVALTRLAERYAATIDEAFHVAAELDSLPAQDDHVAKRIAALAAKVEAQQVLAELGPKLLAALESLGASPKGRAALHRGGGGNGQRQGKLALLRQTSGA